MKSNGPKVRLVAFGSCQVEGADIEETLAPVVTYTSIRVLFATVAIHNLELHQMDVVTALIHDDIDKHVYMHPQLVSAIHLLRTFPVNSTKPFTA